VFVVGQLSAASPQASLEFQDVESGCEFVKAALSFAIDVAMSDIRVVQFERCDDGHIHYACQLLKLPMASRYRGRDFPMPNFFTR
jgi:hypothetical protein